MTIFVPVDNVQSTLVERDFLILTIPVIRLEFLSASNIGKEMT